MKTISEKKIKIKNKEDIYKPQKLHGVGEWSSCKGKGASLVLLPEQNLCNVEADLEMF